MIFTAQEEYKQELTDEIKHTFEILFEVANETIVEADRDRYAERVDKCGKVSGHSRRGLWHECILKIAYPDVRDRHADFRKKVLDGENTRYTLIGATDEGKVIHIGNIGDHPIIRRIIFQGEAS